MGANQDRRVPVETFRRLSLFGLRLNVNGFAGAAVEAGQVAPLPLGVNNIRIVRVGKTLVPIGAQGDIPV